MLYQPKPGARSLVLDCGQLPLAGPPDTQYADQPATPALEPFRQQALGLGTRRTAGVEKGIACRPAPVALRQCSDTPPAVKRGQNAHCFASCFTGCFTG